MAETNKSEPNPTVVTREDDPLVKAFKSIAFEMWTHNGIIREHTEQIEESSERIASSLDGIASAITNLANAICGEYYKDSVSETLADVALSIDRVAKALPKNK